MLWPLEVAIAPIRQYSVHEGSIIFLLIPVVLFPADSHRHVWGVGPVLNPTRLEELFIVGLL